MSDEKSYAYYLDGKTEMPPPWEKCPAIERYSIGWRMGYGEGYLWAWHDFMRDLGTDYKTRLAYLKRHAPAPYSWGDFVESVLEPDRERLEVQDLDRLLQLGLVESDIVYPTWLKQQTTLQHPWKKDFDSTPVDCVRYGTRELSFWSRRIAELRQADPNWELPKLPFKWRACKHAFMTQRVDNPNPKKGLLLLVQMLVAGKVLPPWGLGCAVSDYRGDFENNMGYADAFSLWVMSAFDDQPHFQRYLESCEPMPNEWEDWIAERILI